VETEVANAIKQHLGRQARAPPFVKLAEDRQHTPDVSEAVEGNGGVTFYRALLLVLAALKCAVCEISITMVVVGRTGDDLTGVDLETCDVLAAPKTKPREGGSCKFRVGDGGNRLVRWTVARRRKKEAVSVPRSAALFTLIFILGHV
jgi:hypothetical protein